jgi:hypothetical protein
MKPKSAAIKYIIAFHLFMFLSFTMVLGQKDPLISKVYLQVGAGPSTYEGSFSKYGVQMVLRNDWVATISHFSGNMVAKNLPGDYEPGSGSFLGIPLNNGKPLQKLDMKSLTAGKIFKLNRSVWFTAEGGVSVTKGDKFTFTPQAVTTADMWIASSTTSNYDTKRENKTAVGGMMQANLLWAFCPFAGLCIGGFANLNSIQSQVGFEFSLVVGWMHRGPRH